MSDRRLQQKDSGDTGSSVGGAARDSSASNVRLGVPDAPTVIRTASSARNVSDQQTVLSADAEQHADIRKPLKSGELGRFLEGEVLGHFRLDKFVGGGGMGAVFRAQDTRLSRTVAVKILSRGQHADEDAKKRFELEAQSAARLDHENIARVYYVGEQDGWNYIVFEYIEGIDIRQMVIQRGPLPIELSVDFTLQIAEALHHASQREVVHRDIKPSNVLVTPTGKAKVVDMGLARFHHLDASDDELTASGVTLGTFDYISPEQARDPRNADVRSDIYSLGCTLFFMLAARPPFSEGTVLQKLLSHTSDEPPDVRQFRSDIPSPLMNILHKMLAKQPEMRHQRPSELIGELLLLSEKLGLSSGRRSGTVWISPAQQPLSRWEIHLPWILPMTLFVATVLGMDYFRTTGNSVPARPPQPYDVVAAGVDGVTDLKTDPDLAAIHEVPPANKSGDENASDVSSSSHTDEASSETPAKRSDQSSPVHGSPIESDGPLETHGGAVDTENDENSPKDRRRASETQSSEPAPAGSKTDETGTARQNNRSSQTVRLIAPDGEDATVLPTLQAALENLTSRLYPTATSNTIELCFNGPQSTQPFPVPLPEMSIRAGEGFQPVIVFQPDDSIRTSMIIVHAGKLTLQGVHFDVELKQPVDHWSLFEVRESAQLELNDCTMTIRNGDRDHGRHTYFEDVAFFHVGAGTHELRTPPKLVPEATPPQIRLNNCVARGEATFIWAAEAGPFNVLWQHGLLLTTERLVRASGRARRIDDSATSHIKLERVTVVADKGLCHTSIDRQSPNLVKMNLACNDCVLFTQTSSPKISQRGNEGLETMRDRISFRGRNVIFPIVPSGTQRPVYWRISSDDLKPSFWEIGFSEFHRDGSVSNEQLREINIAPFRLPGPLQQVHTLSIHDYAWDRILTPEELESLSIKEGCSPSQLPPLPDSDHGEDAAIHRDSQAQVDENDV